jgi:hypothetical protein
MTWFLRASKSSDFIPHGMLGAIHPRCNQLERILKIHKSHATIAADITDTN